jgi:hypothetical protein
MNLLFCVRDSDVSNVLPSVEPIHNVTTDIMSMAMIYNGWSDAISGNRAIWGWPAETVSRRSGCSSNVQIIRGTLLGQNAPDADQRGRG